MATEPRVILLEFNELSPGLMSQFMSEGVLPNFSRMRDESDVYTTDAQEKQENLEPWIQWVTVHTGLRFDEHGVFRLSDGQKVKEPRIWDVVAKSGGRSLVVSSMNAGQINDSHTMLVPDAWNTEVTPTPAEFEPFFTFVRKNVHEHSNTEKGVTPAEAASFLAFMVSHGMSPATVRMILGQLMTERFRGTQWKRVAILDAFQRDIFRWYYRKHRPRFASFFANSTAHLQHMYWRNLEPEHFQSKPTEAEQKRFGEAIRFGYMSMDRILGQFMDELVDENTTLVFATALSQQPCLLYEHLGGKQFYRPINFERLVKFVAPSDPCTCDPVMSQQFYVHFESEDAAIRNESKFSNLKVEGDQALYVTRQGTSLFMGCRVYRAIDAKAPLVDEAEGQKKSAPFFDLFYQVEGKKSGMHHPDGMLWFYRKGQKQTIHPDKVPLVSIAPTLLKMMNLNPPPSMRGPVLPLSH